MVETGVGAADDEPGDEFGARIGDLRMLGDASSTADCPIPNPQAVGSLSLEHGDVHLPVQVAEGFAEQGLHVVVCRSRHGTDVDVDVDDVGNGVRLLPAVHHVGGEGRVRLGMTHPGHGNRHLSESGEDPSRPR